MNRCQCGCGKEIEQYNCRRQIKRFYKGHNIGSKHGSDHPSWKGGRTFDKNKYVLIWHPNHPRNMCGNYVHEHVLVMEKYLGRYLTENEVVHHKDENKQNNALSNLQLMTEHEHRQYHVKKMWREGKYDNRRYSSSR